MRTYMAGSNYDYDIIDYQVNFALHLPIHFDYHLLTLASRLVSISHPSWFYPLKNNRWWLVFSHHHNIALLYSTTPPHTLTLKRIVNPRSISYLFVDGINVVSNALESQATSTCICKHKQSFHIHSIYGTINPTPMTHIPIQCKRNQACT